MFALSSAISIVISVAMFSGMILTPLYVQEVRGISPLDSGLLMLPGAIVMGLLSPILGRFFGNFGEREMACIGFAISFYSTNTDMNFMLLYCYLYIILYLSSSMIVV